MPQTYVPLPLGPVNILLIGRWKSKWALFTLSICVLWCGRHLFRMIGLFTLQVWCAASRWYSLSSPCPPLSNVFFNPLIPNSTSFGHWAPWTQATLLQPRHFVHPISRNIFSFGELQAKHQSIILFLSSNLIFFFIPVFLPHPV